MGPLKDAPNASEIQHQSKATVMPVEANLNSNDSNHDESDALKFLSGNCNCGSVPNQENGMESDKPTHGPAEAVCQVPLPNVNTSGMKCRWSQKPIVVAGGAGAGSALEQLHHPNDIALDANGTIYIADYSNKRVVRWTMGGNQMGEIVAGGDSPVSSPLALRYPRRIDVTRDGSLYILDDDRVLKLAKDAAHYTVISQSLDVPTSLFVDDKDNVYVSERSNHRVLKWTPDMASESEGIVVAGGGRKGSAAHQLSWPRAVFVDNDENVYVVDRDNARIQHWPKDAQLGSSVVTHSHSRVLLGMKVDRNGNIYGLDWKNNQILKYSSDGGEEVLVSDDGSHEVLNSPTALEFNHYGNMFVNDKYNHRVVMFPLESGVFGS